MAWPGAKAFEQELYLYSRRLVVLKISMIELIQGFPWCNHHQPYLGKLVLFVHARNNVTRMMYDES